MAYSGEMQWRTRAGDEVVARLGEPLTKDMHAQALRTALDPRGSWIPAVLEAADRRLSEVRRHVPDAGGLVIAGDQETARAYAALLKKISGETPTVVLSDEKGSSKKIEKFTHSEQRWMVAVRMVSEGVDVPRLAVGVWATTTSTPLFFAQAVGRFVRARSRGETASVFLPSVPHLLEFASDMEAQRDHVLGRRVTDEDDIFAAEEGLLAAANAGERRVRRARDVVGGARLDGLLRPRALRGRAVRPLRRGDGRLGGGDGLPRHPRPARARPGARAAALAAERARPQAEGRRRRRPRRRLGAASSATHQQLGVLRRELNGLVAAWHHRTGQAHGITHTALRKECGGPPAAVANAEQLHERINRIREWAVRQDLLSLVQSTREGDPSTPAEV